MCPFFLVSIGGKSATARLGVPLTLRSRPAQSAKQAAVRGIPAMQKAGSQSWTFTSFQT